MSKEIETVIYPPMKRTVWVYPEGTGFENDLIKYFLPFPYIVFMMSRGGISPSSEKFVFTMAFANKDPNENTPIFLPPLQVGMVGEICIHHHERVFTGIHDAISYFWGTPFNNIDQWAGVHALEHSVESYKNWQRRSEENITKVEWARFSTMRTMEDMIKLHEGIDAGDRIDPPKHSKWNVW